MILIYYDYPWNLPLSYTQCQSFKGGFGYRLTVNQVLAGRGKAEEHVRAVRDDDLHGLWEL